MSAVATSEAAAIRAAARQHWMMIVSGLGAVAAGLLAAAALLGYAVNLPSLIHIRTGLESMSPLTAVAISALACSILALIARRDWLLRLGATAAIVTVATTLVTRILSGADTASLWLGTEIFHREADAVGRTSVATALVILLIAAALLLRHRRAAADWAAGIGFVVSGIAVLGYFYGVTDLYAVPIFNSMALNTATALLCLSAATLLAEPTLGWAGVITSEDLGGGATRRQLAIIALPILTGKLLLVATASSHVGPAVAMALLVVITALPLSALILRDGWVLNALDRERAHRLREQDERSREMADRLARQAVELARESDERARVEATMYRAQRMEAVGQLTGGIAHDFNNLLMAIHGNLELLRDRLPAGNERLARYVANATAATDKGAKITAQLLAFSRSQRLDIRAVELDPVLISARELIGNALGPDVRLDIRLASGGAWVSTDPDQLELAILNLAVNSRDAMPEGGQIRIESAARAAEGFIAIRVIDDGVGMTEEVASQAIEPFFTTKERGKGTGLGLAQVYGFVRQCGGDLRITSAPGRGTTVEILLRATAAIAAAPMPAASTQIGGAIAARGRQVLVIDDDDGVRAVIVEALINAGFDVVEAPDGESGLAILDGMSPAAAVIDFLMPGMNGAEVARIAQQRRPGLPIVFVSGYSDTVALDDITGAVVLRKPFDVDGLSRALTSVLH